MRPNQAANKTLLKPKLLASSASVFALLALGTIHSAFAQDQEGTSVEPEEEVIVQGMRQSIESAQTLKREASQVVDSVTAVDIGAMPDRSISETLQRVPGVQLQRTNENRDPARLASEGGDVFIRGLSWVRTELNGRDIFSANNGRSLGFEDVSADLMSGIDVFKNPTADMIEGALGGTVNLRTRKPFDSSDMLLAGSIDYNYADLYGKGFTSYSGLYSNNWDLTDGGKIGFLFSASIADIGNRTDSIQTGRYEGADVDGTEYWLPTNLGFRRIDWQQDRDAFSTALQWSPNEDLTVTAEGFYASANPVDIERSVSIDEAWGGNISPNDTQTYDKDNYVTSGTVSNAALTFNNRYGNRDSNTSDFSINLEYTPSDNWTISGDLQYVSSEADILSMTVYTQLAPPPPVDIENARDSGVSVDFDLRGSNPIIDANDQRQLQQDQYWWAAAMDHIEDNQAESLAGRLDAEYTFENGSFLSSIQFGLRLSNKDATTKQSGWNWSILANQWWNTPPADVGIIYLDDPDVAPNQTELYTFDDFFRGDIDVPAVGWIPKTNLVSNTARAYSYLEPVTTINGWGWSPLVAPDAYDLDPRGDNVSAGINEQQEKTTAFYGQVNFAAGNVMDGNFGIRVVETKIDAMGRSVAGGVAEECAAAPSADCTSAANFVDAYVAELGDYKTFNNSYTNVLPSLNLRFFVTEEVQMRFGASQAMVRPDFSQTRPYSSLSFAFLGNEFDPEIVEQGYVGDGEGGQPNLEPTTANQIDGTVEWYFNDSGSLTAALFYKSIEDYIALVTQVEEHTYGGETHRFEVSRQTNADDGTLQGFEIAYQQFYDMLPGFMSGFGLQANYTYIDNEGGVNTAVNPFEDAQAEGATDEALPIEGMSKSSYNISLMYEKYDISARLAYNWRERFLLTTSAANLNRPVWSGDYGQLDGSFFYSLNDNWKLGIQATNLLNSRTELEVARGDGTLKTGQYSWTDTDRRIAFVVRAQL